MYIRSLMIVKFNFETVWDQVKSELMCLFSTFNRKVGENERGRERESNYTAFYFLNITGYM